MALLSFLPDQTNPKKQPQSKPKKKVHHQQKQKQKQKETEKQKQKPPSSWDQIKNLLSCKQMEGPTVHDPSKKPNHEPYTSSSSSKLGSSSCGSFCNFSDVVYGNARVVHRSDNSPESSSVGQETRSLTRKHVTRGSTIRGLSGSARCNGTGSSTSSSRAMQFRKLSGCYECHMIVDPSRYPISPRICACPQCGEVFPKLESLELHQAVRHAVSELGPEDSGRNIVEIIFKSSWLRKDSPIYKIERILKVHNTQRTIQRFEDCRDAVKSRALGTTRKDPRCAADGNELLRFYCTTVSCTLGSRGSTSLCGSVPDCGVCTVIRHGFQSKTGRLSGGGGANEFKGVRTTASSGKAHDSLRCFDSRRAMLVCRVIAGRVKRAGEDTAAMETAENRDGWYDSVAGSAGMYSRLEELVAFNPRAILPCFVVIYKVIDKGL